MHEAQQDWLVVGAGMLGLTLALRLATAGHRVRVVEAAPTLGGLTASHRWGGLSWDRYYHVISSRDHALLALLAELGLTDAITWRRTRTLFFDGRAHHPLDDALDYLRLPALPLASKLRIGLNILYGSRFADLAALEDRSAESWLTAWSGRAGYERLWRPLLRAKLGANQGLASAAYIGSVMRRFHGARQGVRQTESFGFVAGGYATVVGRLLDALRARGVAIDSGVAVRAVAPAEDGVGLRLSTADTVRRAARVVLTCASPLVTRLCEPSTLGTAVHARHTGLRYQGVICLSLLLRRPLGGAYLTYITDDTIPFTTAIEMSALTGTASLAGHHLVYLPKYVASDDPLLHADDAEIAADFLAGLARLYPDITPADVVHQACARSAHVMALPTPGYSAALPGLTTAQPDLFVVNSAQIRNASLSVDETVALANAAAASLVSA